MSVKWRLWGAELIILFSHYCGHFHIFRDLYSKVSEWNVHVAAPKTMILRWPLTLNIVNLINVNINECIHFVYDISFHCVLLKLTNLMLKEIPKTLTSMSSIIDSWCTRKKSLYSVQRCWNYKVFRSVNVYHTHISHPVIACSASIHYM